MTKPIAGNTSMQFADFFRRPPALPERDVLRFADVSLSYSIRESARRRCLGLELRADGTLAVAAPSGTSLGLIRSFVKSRRLWIETKRAQLLLQTPPPAALALQSGTRLPYLGAELTLTVKIAAGKRTLCCVGPDAGLALKVPHETRIRPTLETWYRREAARHASARLAHFVPQVGRAARKLTIRAQRTRWGSCSARGAISLNWRLMLATPEIFDYVLVHELCHLLEPNHSARFWNEVGRVLPDYRARRAALRRFGQTLAF